MKLPAWVPFIAVMATVMVVGNVLIGARIPSGKEQKLTAERDAALADRARAVQDADSANAQSEELRGKASFFQRRADSLEHARLARSERFRIVDTTHVTILDRGQVDTVAVPEVILDQLHTDSLEIVELRLASATKDIVIAKKDTVIADLRTASARDSVALAKQMQLTEKAYADGKSVGRRQALLTIGVLALGAIVLHR